MPYLRLFGHDGIAREEPVDKERVILGRSPECDIVLPDAKASRQHAQIITETGKHILKDMASRGGTLVNGNPAAAHHLQHGDRIEIADIALEYRTDDLTETVDPGAATKQLTPRETQQARKRGYRYLPAGMGVAYRWIRCDPGRIFNPGDTLEVGDGGILIAVTPETQPLNGNVILEVELGWPNGSSRRMLGEVMQTLPPETRLVQAMCIKLHQLDSAKHKEIVDQCRCHDWIRVAGPAKGAR